MQVCAVRQIQCVRIALRSLGCLCSNYYRRVSLLKNMLDQHTIHVTIALGDKAHPGCPTDRSDNLAN